jgi:hypothetical protein
MTVRDLLGRRRVTLGVVAVVVAGLSVALWMGRTGNGPQPDRSAPRATSRAPGSSSAIAPGAPAPSVLPQSAASTLPAATVPGVGGSPVRWWRPSGVLTWQWQLKGKLDLSVAANVYDVDAVESTPADVAALRGAGRKTICYVNAGAYEDFRPDRKRYPALVLGKALDGWPGERWLDIRHWDALEPILRDRFAMCRQKGFDGVEADNVDGYANTSGFPLTADDQLTFNRRIADLAHTYGLAVGLKNDVEQAASLAPWFDYSVDEECAKYAECDRLRVFTAAGKPVFHVEYALATDKFCATTRQLGFSSMRKRVDLDVWRQPC